MEHNGTEVLGQAPRYPFEKPLLLVRPPEPEEWYIKNMNGIAVAVCRTSLDEDGTSRPLTPSSPVPEHVATAILAYDGEGGYAPVKDLVNPIAADYLQI